MNIQQFQVLTREEMLSVSRNLRDGLDEHIRWACRSQAALLGGEGMEGDLLNPDAHVQCKLGRWLLGMGPGAMASTEEFKRLGELHERFHRAVYKAASARVSGGVVDADAIEILSTSQTDFLLGLNEYICQLADSDMLFDPLTGVLNRKDMVRLLKREKARIERLGQPCALALADLDHFKLVNDEHGHDAGDVVLTQTAKAFSSGLRSYDLLFRYGGEEFLFCLPGTSIEEAAVICERMRERMEKASFRVNSGGTVQITVSFGIAQLSALAPVEDSVKSADVALYKAKAEGRNRVCCLP